MKLGRAPSIEPRRTAEFAAELFERARQWLPVWDGAAASDFGAALLAIAARYGTEVAQRLDRGGEKMALGFLDWLAVRGKAARPARMPVVFRMAEQAPAPVLARAPIRLQADAGGVAVVFETEADLRIAPGRLERVLAVDADADAYYVQPPGLSSLEPLEPLPVQWQLKSFAPAGATTLQLDPPLGLEAEMILDIAGRQYRVMEVDNDIVSIEPALDADAPVAGTTARKVRVFAPYDGARNRQNHALYLGHAELLDIVAGAVIEVVGAQRLGDAVAWEYWGKVGEGATGWQPLEYAPADRQRSDAVVLLKTREGALEPTAVAGVSSRWLRARRTTLTPAIKPLLAAEALGLRVNCSSAEVKCPPEASPSASPDVEAMTNTTPLALTSAFHPLGRVPRQFDAFYLGCAEAFSKKGARVQLCFELGDPTFSALSAVRSGTFVHAVLAGIGKDRALHLLTVDAANGTISRFRDREGLRPPLPADAGATPAQVAPLNLQPRCRPAILAFGNDFYVIVAAGGQVWMWHEHAGDAQASGWRALAALPEQPDRAAQIEDLVVTQSAGVPRLAALGNCTLWAFSGTAWKREQTLTAANQPVMLAALAPVYVEASGVLSPGPYMIGVSVDHRLYRVAQDGLCTPLPVVFPGNVVGRVDAGTAPSGGACPVGGIRPAAVLRDSGRLLVVAASEVRDELFAFLSLPNDTAVDDVARVALPGNARAIGGAIELTLDAGRIEFLATARGNENRSFVVSWLPFDEAVPPVAFAAAPPERAVMGGAPLVLPQHVVVPGVRGDAFVARRDPGGRRVLSTALEEGVVLPDTGTPYATGDAVSVMLASGDRALATIAEDYAAGGEVLYRVDTPFGAVAGEPDLLAFQRSAPGYGGNIQAADALELDAADADTAIDDILLIEASGAGGLYLVVDVDDTVSPRVATLIPDLPQNAGAAGYWLPTASAARVAPVLRLDPATSGDWDAALLDRAPLYFPGATPAVQHGRAYELAPGNRPKVVALDSPWHVPPADPVDFVVDDAYAGWRHMLADTSSNPELSWEYWNGKGWWKLDVEADETLHLKTTGAVRFDVPPDLVASDWAGKTNYWIRARLVGGDYGQERVVVTSMPQPDGSTEQTVTRTTENVRAPSVVALHVSYAVCSTVPPMHVLTEDAGTLRDQSAANRTPGAVVEAFVPLATLIGRLDAGMAPEDGAGNASAGCGCDHPRSSSSPDAGGTEARATSAAGRALYLGFDAVLAGDQIAVLLLVDQEQPYDAYAPLQVEALIGERFEPVVASDGTRALGESGLVTMNFPVPPTTAELFGKPLKWIRLRPSGDSTSWSPGLRGAYLNAAWASAAETMTRELVGSSTGEPNLTVQLARPPLVEGSLELRVREPLSDEEIEAINADDPTHALTGVPDLPGVWVRWMATTDPADCGPHDRVYALDEATGVIRFGDSLHGAIPPIGRDAIVAFSYRRTEPASDGGDTVPANTVVARTTLNLVTPVESVETAIAADGAAGGAPPEPRSRVVRFGSARLRHRGRAVSARDLEDIALESSPDIAQARCLVAGKGGGPTVRMVVVMRGTEPMPSRAVKRELRRTLLEAAPVALASSQRLRIDGPSLRRLRIGLQLAISAIEESARLAQHAEAAIRSYFDPASGGPDGTGWPLATAPTEDDIAYCLLDAPALAGIGRITLTEIDGAPGGLQPAAYRPDELAWLPEDAIRIDFDIPASAP